MFKKFVFSVSMVFCLLAGFATPAQADAPDFDWWRYPVFTYDAADCSQYGYNFSIAHTWDVEGHILTFYNKDGTVDYTALHAKVLHTFTNKVTGKAVSGRTTDTFITRFPYTGIFEIRGFFQRIIIPGVGPIFMDGGHKVFYATWMTDGTLHFDLISNAGPTGYTENDFSALCAYLPEE